MINNEERIKKTPVNKYKEIFGIEKTVFDRMLKILNIARTYNKESNMGRPTKLEALDCLIITLMYWRGRYAVKGGCPIHTITERQPLIRSSFEAGSLKGWNYMYKESFGVRLGKLRKSRCLSMEKTSELIDVSVSYYGLVERGQRMFSIPKLIVICKLFSVSLDYLILGADEGDVSGRPTLTFPNELSDFDTEFIAIMVSLSTMLEIGECKLIVNFISGLVTLLNKKTNRLNREGSITNECQ